MIITTSIFAVPLMIVVWTLDSYLFLVTVRLLLARLGGPRTVRLALALQPLTDGIPDRVHRWLIARHVRPVPLWGSWVIVIGGAMTLRYLLIGLVMTL